MKVEINKSMKLSEHFTLGELCKTKHDTEDGNIPSHVAIENLKRICENWLEDLRYSYNRLYVWNVEGGMWNEDSHAAVCAGVRPQSKVAGDCTLAPDPGAAPRPGGCAKTRGLRQSWGRRGALAMRGYSRGNWRNLAFWLLSKDKNVKNG